MLLNNSTDKRYIEIFFQTYDDLLDAYYEGVQSFYYYDKGKFIYIASEAMLFDIYDEGCRLFTNRLTEEQYQQKLKAEISTYQHILDNPQNYSNQRLQNAKAQLDFLEDLLLESRFDEYFAENYKLGLIDIA